MAIRADHVALGNLNECVADTHTLAHVLPLLATLWNVVELQRRVMRSIAAIGASFLQLVPSTKLSDLSANVSEILSTSADVLEHGRTPSIW
jgi:hypothetical protein